ncbi:sodium:proton exchanger [Candidatus Pacearchaeota archaeon]|nr:sodium:proton exchanger [Candidatus Pacearchaeota archaeon]
MGQEVLISLSLIIGLAAIITILAKAIKQPTIIAYLIAGILAGPLAFNLINPGVASAAVIQTLAHIGVALLLFIVGLSLDFRILKDVGGISTVAGSLAMLITAGIGYLIANAFGYGSLTALYLAVALAFSSTVVVIKLLSDKKEMHTLHGKIALGILIVQDFAAALALMIFPVLNTGSSTVILTTLVKILALIILIFTASALVMNKVLSYLARNQEVLFLFGVAWALLIAMLFSYLGLSLEIGALIAGMALASSRYTLELTGKIRPLRDFFVILFFVFFGSQLAPPISSSLIITALAFSLFVLLGKPIIIMTCMRFFGYKKRTNFLTSASLAQISEFSLILIMLGFTLGHVSQNILSLVILIALITIGISSYTTHYAHNLFNALDPFLNIFEGKSKKEDTEKEKKTYDIILFGCDRMGKHLLKTLKAMNTSFLVIDNNPKIVTQLNKKKIDAIYGDAHETEVLNELNLQQAKLVISTIPDIESNLRIQNTLKEMKSKATYVATAEYAAEAEILYHAGIDYVLLPHFLGGKYASAIISKFKTNHIDYAKLRDQQKKELKKLDED